MCTLNSAYNKVTFNTKLAIIKENLCTKYTPFTYKHTTLNEKPPIMKQNLHIFDIVDHEKVSLNTRLTKCQADLM